LVYRDSPAEGPSFYDSVKDEVAMDQGEISLVAEPFFFPFSDLPKINYAWKMNDADVQTPKKPDVLTVRNTTGGSGESQISLAASDPLNIFHQAVYDFLIKF
jgi:hypothetical protein